MARRSRSMSRRRLINGTADLWWDVIDDIVNARDMLSRADADRHGDARLLDAGPEIRANAYLHDYLTLERARGGPARRACATSRGRRRRFRAPAPQDADDLGRGPHDRGASAGHHRRAHRQPLQSEAAFGGEARGSEMTDVARILEPSSARRRGTWPIPTAMPAPSCNREVRTGQGGRLTSRRSRRGTACCAPSMPSICMRCRAFRSTAATSASPTSARCCRASPRRSPTGKMLYRRITRI